MCMMSPETPLNAAIECADGALYAVKRDGRNKVLCHEVPEGDAAPIVTSLPVRRRFGARGQQVAPAPLPANDGETVSSRKVASS
jgi:hypothetical protein